MFESGIVRGRTQTDNMRTCLRTQMPSVVIFLSWQVLPRCKFHLMSTFHFTFKPSALLELSHPVLLVTTHLIKDYKIEISL